MFSSLRNHTNNLIHSQRFYYNSYEFYNDFQDIEVDAKNDLGKIFFYLKRKSKGKIFTYLKEIPEDEFPRKLRGNKIKVMENIVYPYLQLFYENNYSDLKPDLQKFKQSIEIHYLPGQKEQYTSLTEDQQWHEYSEKICAEIRQAKADIGEELGVMENEDKINQANIRFCLEAFSLYVIKQVIQNQDTQNKTRLYHTLLVKYRQFIKMMIQNMLESHSWNILYLAIPNLGNLPKIIHPITLGLQAFTQEYHKRQYQQGHKQNSHLLKQPKIVFLNLDGKQHYQNIREIKRINFPILYISIYKEPNQGDLNNIHLHQQDDIENFNKISQVLSNKMIQQLDPKKPTSHAGSKMLLFPLNSIKLQKQFRKKKQNFPSSQKNLFPKLGTSEDIHFLFETMIYEEIRSFNPTIILLSYNGSLDIKQDQFSEMIRNLTIMSDHKILLFPNLSELFEVPEILPEDQDDEDAFDKFALYKQFYNKYMNYSIQQVSCASEYEGQNRPNIINTQRFLHNLSMFIKLSSGTYSMKPRIIQTPSSKYLIGNRYMYLQQLSEFPGFENIKKYTSNKWDCKQLEILFKQYGKAELKENKKQNQFYQGLIENVFTQLFNNCENIPSQALYRLEELKCQIEAQYEVQRKSAEFMNLLKNNLIQAKQKLLLENLQTQKHKKVYKSDKDNKESQNNQVRCYTFCMHGDETGEELQFDKYTQVIFDPHCSMIVIVNYKVDKQYQILVSNEFHITGQHITVSVIKASQSIKDQYNNTKMDFDQHNLKDLNKLVRQNFIYVNYNYCFINGVLYLYWPQKWCLQDQVMCKLLNMAYKPQIDKKIIRVYMQNNPNNENCYIYEQVPYQFEMQFGAVIPRFGCSSCAYTSEQFYIFGGIYDSKFDFLESCCCINQVKIVDGKLFFKNIPKNQNNIRLRPKINYTIDAEKGTYAQTTVTSVTISGGYGRETTNFYNIYSYDSYNFSFESKILTLKPQFMEKQLKTRLMQRRVANMNEPIQINQVGKFPVANDQNFLLCDRQVKFVQKPMDKFIFQLQTKKKEGSDQQQKQYNFVSFLEDNYRFNEMKTDLKKLFLFGFNNFIREAIFSKFWSPELYVLQNLKPFIMQISLKTDKNATSQKISIPTSVMPRQEDMVSMCLEQDNLYLLTSSPASAILAQLSKNRHKLILYKGRIQNLRKHDILMEPKLAFPAQKYGSMKAKTIFAIDKSIKAVGGFQQPLTDNIHRRNDYILDQTDKQKFKTRIRKVQSPDVDLNRPYPVIVKSQETYLIYSVIQSLTSIEEIDKQQEQIYKLVIQSFTIDQASKQQIVLSSQLRFYMAVPDHGTFKKYRINPSFKQPRLVRISKYKRFSIKNFKDMINRVSNKSIKKMDELNNQIESLQIMFKNAKPDQKNDAQYRNKQEQLQKKQQKIRFFRAFQEFLSKQFKNDIDQKILQSIQIELLQNFKRKMHQLVLITQRQQYEKSYQNEEFLKELKNCYTIIHKHLLETILQPGVPKPNEHIFIIEDKGSQRTKYLAIGPLGTTNLNFYKIFFKNQLMLCLNQASDECFFYHPTALGCEQIIMDINRYKREKIIEDVLKEEETNRISVKI